MYSPHIHNEPFLVFFFFFFTNFMNFCMELSKTKFIAKGKIHIGNIQKLSVAFSHCLCGGWYKFMTPWDTVELSNNDNSHSFLKVSL